MKLFTVIKKFGILVLLLSASAAFPVGGSGISGGGDRYVQDFLRVANVELWPWFLKNGSNIVPAVSAVSFKKSVDTLIEDKSIFSADEVYESCDGSKKGRQVEVCYNQVEKKIIVSRSKYPVDLRYSVTKRRLVAHEIFRIMELENNDYKVSNQLMFDDVNVPATADIEKARCFLSNTDKNDVIKNYIVSTQGLSDGLQTTYPDGSISSKLVIAPDFLAEVIVYAKSYKKLPQIFLTGYEAHFQTNSPINNSGRTSLHFARNDDSEDRSIDAECEIFE